MDQVSIVIPCFNQAHYLSDCLGSLLAQCYKHWEAIVVNDGSPDDVKGAVQSYGQHDSRIKYLEKENGGLSSARNAGLQLCTGRWIVFLVSDDLIDPQFLQVQVTKLKNHRGIAFSYCDHLRGETENPRIQIKNSKPSCEFILENPVLDMVLRWESEFGIPIHCAMFDSRLFQNLGVHFNESLPNHEDWDMWMQILRLQPKIFYIPQILAIYRTSQSSMSRNRSLMWHGFTKAIRIQLDIYSDDPEVVRCLQYKQRLTDYLYGRTMQGFMRRQLNQNFWYKKNAPWPIQKFMESITKGPVF